MSDPRIEGYAKALFEIARAEDSLDEVEDELFRFARSYESSDALRNALTDDMIPAAKRQAIVEDLQDHREDHHQDHQDHHEDHLQDHHEDHTTIRNIN
jgi:F0F1-type ATP synthase delta subunit